MKANAPLPTTQTHPHCLPAKLPKMHGPCMEMSVSASINVCTASPSGVLFVPATEHCSARAGGQACAKIEERNCLIPACMSWRRRKMPQGNCSAKAISNAFLKQKQKEVDENALSPWEGREGLEECPHAHINGRSRHALQAQEVVWQEAFLPLPPSHQPFQKITQQFFFPVPVGEME